MLETDTLDVPTRTGEPDERLPDGAFIAFEHPYIARTNQYVLKSGDTFIVNDPLGDINGHDDGLFVNDTRVLSQLRLTFGGRAPSLLSGSVSSDNAAFTAHLTNRPLPPLGGDRTPEGVIHVERMRVLSGTVLNEAIEAYQLRHERGGGAAVHFVRQRFPRHVRSARSRARPARGTIDPPRVEERRGAARLCRARSD